MPKKYPWIAPQIGIALSGAAGTLGRVAGLSWPETVALSLIVLMASWWIGEAFPFYVVATLPALSVPLLEKVGLPNASVLWYAYANPVIGLFLGSFWIARAVEVQGLATYLRDLVLRWTGTRPTRLLIGLLGLSAGLSALLNNTAVTALLLPVVRALNLSEKAAYTLSLAIAWGASIGGVATLTGSAPNGITAALLEAHQAKVSFSLWLLYGLPAALGGLFFAHTLLRRGMTDLTTSQTFSVAAQPIPPGAKRVGLLLMAILVAWLTLPFPAWAVALAGSLLLFLPGIGPRGEALLSPTEGHHIPWGILWLFGGGLALSQLLELSGLSIRLTSLLTQALHQVSPFLLWFLIIGLPLWMTELLSNTALCSLFLPVLLPVLGSLGYSPYTAIWVGIATSMAFMLPVATPPNALAHSMGGVPLSLMRRKGFWLNLCLHLYLAGLAYLTT